METGHNRNQNNERSHNLFGNSQHFSALVNYVLQPVRKYQQKKARKQFVPERARFKMKLFYLDGNTSVHYSYDFYHVYTDGVKKRQCDEATGLIKLMRYLQKVNGKFISAVIWCKLGHDTSTELQAYNCEIVKYVRNREPQIDKRINFVNGQLDWSVFVKGGAK